MQVLFDFVVSSSCLCTWECIIYWFELSGRLLIKNSRIYMFTLRTFLKLQNKTNYNETMVNQNREGLYTIASRSFYASSRSASRSVIEKCKCFCNFVVTIRSCSFCSWECIGHFFLAPLSIACLRDQPEKVFLAHESQVAQGFFCFLFNQPALIWLAHVTHSYSYSSYCLLFET